MKKLWILILVLLSSMALAACADDGASEGGGGSSGGQRTGSQDALTIVAATELMDLEPVVQRASDDLGFDIELQFPAGTLENSENLKLGNFDSTVDATWFATNRYVNLIGASDKLADETKIATSPVAFGVWDEAAKRLGWDTDQPTWTDFVKAAQAGDFTFGMTNPAASNSGFSALVSVSTALADTGAAITPQDLDRVAPTLEELFQAQTLVSGSSGWLADAFVADPEKADAIVNYESTLHQLRAEGLPIQVIVPRDGVVSADYPLSTLAQPANPNASEQVRQLADWLLEHQEDIAQTFRRPVEQVSNMPAELASQQAIELPFPANQSVVDELLFAYNNQYRQPGTTMFILDASGSMEGDRIQALKDTMNSLIDGSAANLVGDVSLRDRETVTLLSFDDHPNPPVTVEYNRDNEASVDQLSAYVDGIVASGGTAMYPALLEALNGIDTSNGIPSIVLLSDGEANFGPDFRGFTEIYNGLPEDKRNVPIFIILYGEANVAEMNQLAELTGGAVFDALNGDLEAAFKEIRGFQ